MLTEVLAAIAITGGVAWAIRAMMRNREALRREAKKSEEIDVTPPDVRRSAWYSTANGGADSGGDGGGGDGGD